MTSAYDELGGRRETKEEILARLDLGQNKPPTEAELAAQEVERRERMRRHDAYFARDFLTDGEQVQISRSLAKQYGVIINEPQPTPADDGWQTEE